MGILIPCFQIQDVGETSSEISELLQTGKALK